MNATRMTASVFGISTGVLGFEHGLYESSQDTVHPGGLVISAIGPPCQPATAWHACEPAFPVIPTLRITGVLTVVRAVVVIAWSAGFCRRGGEHCSSTAGLGRGVVGRRRVLQRRDARHCAGRHGRHAVRPGTVRQAIVVAGRRTLLATPRSRQAQTWQPTTIVGDCHADPD